MNKKNNEQPINEKLNSLRKELSVLNTQKATGSNLENPGNVKKIKREIARMLTQIKSQKEVQSEKK